MDPKTFYDVVIVGGGPAGLTAGLYLARARYRVVIVEQDHFGGQVTITHQVVNYPGVAQASGAELTETMRRQAQSFGAEFLLAQVTGLDLTGDVKTVRTTRGALSCFGVLWATGAHPRKVGFAGEAAFQGRGVATSIAHALEGFAHGLGAQRVTVHASRTARPFFERQGYRMLYAQQVERRGVLLENFAMELALEGGEGHGSH